MGRPPLPLGTSGKVLFATLPNGRVKARVKFRDYDGRVRLVSKVGPSRAAAERALKTELTGRQAPGGVGTITSATRMVTLADAWIQADHGWSTGTQRTYRSVIKKQVKPAFGQLCIREVTPGVVSRSLSAIAKSSGPGAAKTARACLSGMFALAIQDGAAAVNRVRDSTAKISTSKRAPRALTVTRPPASSSCSGAGTARLNSTCLTWSTGCWPPAAGSARRWPCGRRPTATANRSSTSTPGPGR